MERLSHRKHEINQHLWNSPGKNTGMGSHSLLLGDLPVPGIEPRYPALSEKAMAPYSSTLAWKIPWMEEPGGLQSMGSLRVGHN